MVIDHCVWFHYNSFTAPFSDILTGTAKNGQFWRPTKWISVGKHCDYFESLTRWRFGSKTRRAQWEKWISEMLNGSVELAGNAIIFKKYGEKVLTNSSRLVAPSKVSPFRVLLTCWISWLQFLRQILGFTRHQPTILPRNNGKIMVYARLGAPLIDLTVALWIFKSFFFCCIYSVCGLFWGLLRCFDKFK